MFYNSIFEKRGRSIMSYNSLSKKKIKLIKYKEKL